MPHKPVRIFTYLIGREISDLKAANDMACNNRGVGSEGKNVFLLEVPFCCLNGGAPIS